MAIRIDVDKLKKSVAYTTTIPQCSIEELSDAHFQEWFHSGVNEEIIRRNVRSIAGQQIIDHLKLNDLNAWTLNRRYREVLKGGWACGSSFKPDTPRQNKNKLIKYENPSNVPAELILLDLPEKMWQAIAAKWNVRKSPDIDGWKWVKDNPIIPIAAAEGAKKAGCLISQTLIPTIAFTGHRASYEKDGDVRFSEFIHPDRKIIICFDRDTKYTTAKDVNRTIKGVGWRLNPKEKPARAKLSVARWWSEEKGIDDVWREHGQSEVINIVKNAIPWKQWVDTSYSLLGYEPNVKFNASKWQLVDIPDNAQLVCLKGKKGSGKTWCLEKLTKEAKENGQASIAVTHRIQLSEALAKRLGLTYISELDEKVDEANNITLCIDSLGKINPESFKGGLIIFDEIVQVLEHFLIGETCYHKRQKILKTLKNLMQIIINSGGRVIIADADLNANTISFFVGLMGETEPFIIENTYQEPAYDCYLSNGFLAVSGNRIIKTPTDIVGVALQKALAGERIFIACTGQKEESKWGSISLEGLFLKHGIISILRADSDTVKEPQHPAFRATSKINTLCDQYQVIIATPSLGTGLSIENLNKFNLVTGIFTGVGSPDAARQFLMRVRDINTPRLIYAADRGLNEQFISLGYSEKIVSERIKELREFQENCLTEHDNQWSEEYPEIKHCNTSRVYFDNLIAEKNYQNMNFKNSIREGLLSENVNVKDITLATDVFESKFDLQNLFEEIGTISAANVEEYRLKLQAQEILEKEEYDKLKGATELSKEERLALEATVLSNKYGGVEITEELIAKDSEGWYNKIKLDYACTVGYEIQKNIQALIGNSQLKKDDGVIIEHDFVQRQNLLSQAEFIRAIEILDFIESEHVFNKTDDESINLYNDMVEQISNINLIFNQQIKTDQYKTNEFNFKLIALVADLIGSISLDKGKKRINKKQIRNYQLVVPDDGRNEIFEAWLIKDKETEARWFERKKEWQIKKLVSTYTEKISIADFIKLKESQLFDNVWERIDTTTRIQLINRVDNFTLPEPIKQKIDPSANNYQEILTDITNWQEISLDIETYGNDAKNKEGLHARKGFIRLIQISNGQTIYYVDLGGRDSDRETIKESLQDFLMLLNKQVSNPDIKIIGQNIHFDLRFLSVQLGFNRARNISDTMIGTKVFFGDYGNLKVLPGGYGLVNLAAKFLGLQIDKSEQKSDWGAPLTLAQIEYAITDPFITYHVWKRLLDIYQNPNKFGFGKLTQDSLMDAWELENDIIPCAIELENVGLPFDKDLATSMLKQCQTIQTQLLNDWAKLVPGLNYSQNQKLKEYLNQNYNLSIKSLNKTALADLAKYPEIKLLGKLRAIKIPIQQLESLLRSAEKSGRVQTVFNTLTGTGRFSSGNSKVFDDLPNLQSISAKANPALKEYNLPAVRTCVRVSNNRGFGIIDLAASHGRIAADVADDETAIAGCNDDSIDNHSKVAVYIAKALGHDVTWEEIAKNKKVMPYKLYRDAAKNTYYGWLNGAGAKRVQEQIKANSGQIVSIEACQAAIKGCENLYPNVVNFRKQLVEELGTKANLLHVDGKYYAVNKIKAVNNRITHLVKIDEDSVDLPYTQCLAAIWSRTEATALKRALIKIINLAENKPEWELKAINYIHDEINIEFNIDYAENILTTVNNIIGDCFAKTLAKVSDGRETNWKKLQVNNWSEK